MLKFFLKKKKKRNERKMGRETPVKNSRAKHASGGYASAKAAILRGPRSR